MTTLPVAVIGAGPVGLAAAAHLIEWGETPILFEAGERIGANVRDWGHVRLFSPWRWVIDKAAARILESNGWQRPDDDLLPTGNDLLKDYMEPLARAPQLAPHIHTNSRVIAISRRFVDKLKDLGRDDAPFILQVENNEGDVAYHEARAVIDATGTWNTPNPTGANGLPAIGEARVADRVRYGIPDVLNAERARYANQRVVVVGSGHSAINAVLDLAALRETAPETRITWVVRGHNMQRIYGGGADDQLPERGALGTRIKALVDSGSIELAAPFRVMEMRQTPQGIDVLGESNGQSACIEADQIITATGSRPNLDMLRELRLDLDSSLESPRTLAPMIDPNIHSCGSVPPHGEAELRHPEANFYIVGMKSYGRAPTFLLATGYEQTRSVVAALVGDYEAAAQVHLDLPETGVCATDFLEDGTEVSCCGTPVTSNISIDIPLVQVNSASPANDKGCC